MSSPPPAFLEGYFVIESDIELDVVAVYTDPFRGNASIPNPCQRAAFPCAKTSSCLFTPGSRIGGRSQTDAPVMLIPTTGWGAPPLGSKWVSQFAPDTVLTATPLSAELRSVFGIFEIHPRCTLQVQVNDTATVFLNGAQVGATVPLLGTPTPVALPGNASFRRGPTNWKWR